MQLHNGAEHIGNVIKSGIIKMAAENVTFVERQYYILQMSQKYECFYCGGVTKQWQRGKQGLEFLEFLQ
jgi:hypothetical protein